MVKNLAAKHVRVLWGMDREKRVEVWRSLGGFQGLELLELGGEPGCRCPMEEEELFMLMPAEGRGTLAGLRVLFLGVGGSQIDDGFLRALVTCGCGEALTSLTLAGHFRFFLSVMCVLLRGNMATVIR